MTEKHLHYLDGWRGLAIVFLLIGHFFPVPGISFGALGVNLFFVLSGYLMGGLLFIKKTPIPLFYKRRISRILPAHIFYLTCTIIFFALAGIPIVWHETVTALFFINNYTSEHAMPLGHIWSLAVEEHSYILLSVVALLSRRFQVDAKWPIAALAAAFSLVGFWYSTQFSGKELEFVKWLHTEVSAYGIFVSCAILLFLSKYKIPTITIFHFLLLMLLAAAAHWWSVPLPIRTTVGVGALALMVNLLSGAPVIVRRILEIRPLTLMGTWSFSIYLWQQPFYYISRIHPILPEYLAAIIAVLFGIAFFYLIENPVRAYLNSVWAKARN